MQGANCHSTSVCRGMSLSLLARRLVLALLFSLLKPFDEWLNVMQENTTSFGVTALLVPEQNGILSNDVSIVQDAQNTTEELQQLAVLIAVDLQSSMPFTSWNSRTITATSRHAKNLTASKLNLG